MADDFGTCPNDLFEDERLLGAPLATLSGAALMMLLADDHGRLDGDPRVIARRIGSTAEDVEKLIEQLAELRWLEVYDAPGRGGVQRLVIQVLDFHSYQGHPHRIAYPAKRGASSYPTRTGETVPSRRARSKAAGDQRGSDEEAAWKSRGSDVEATRKPRGSSVEAPRKGRGSSVASRARDQNSTEQHRGDPEGSPSGHVDPADAAPSPALEAREAQQHAEPDPEAARRRLLAAATLESLCRRGHAYTDTERTGRCPFCDALDAAPKPPRVLPPRRLPEPPAPGSAEPTIDELLAAVERERARERGEDMRASGAVA